MGGTSAPRMGIRDIQTVLIHPEHILYKWNRNALKWKIFESSCYNNFPSKEPVLESVHLIGWYLGDDTQIENHTVHLLVKSLI